MNLKLRAFVFSAIVFGLFLTFNQSVEAKKKITDDNGKSSLEIKLQPDSDDSYFEGKTRISAKTGYPTAIYRGTYNASGSTPETQARQYLNSEKSLFGLTDSDIEDLRLHAVRTDDAGTVVRLRQTWQGLQVNKNAEITIHISPMNVVDYVMNSFQYGIELKNVSPLISNNNAQKKITNHLGIRSDKLKDLTNELMVLRYQNTDYLVHKVNFTTDELIGEWESYVDANTGNILKVEDVAYYYKRKNSSRNSESFLVNGNGNVFNPDPLSTATVAYGGVYGDANDAANAQLNAELVNVTLLDITNTGGTFSLVGPFAEITDFETPNKGLFSQASSTFNFNRSDDGFEAVNTYYHIDTIMRHLNVTLGLNIMPFQYSGGVRFDPSGLGGSDNSHYLPGSGRVSFGEGGVDDAEDADVVVHELGHGLHDWVTNGGGSQVNGLGEGSGDYIAGSYSRALGSWTTSDTAYNWVFNWDGHNAFWNGRILNYTAVYPGGLTGSIHSDGQIWATANMKIWDDIGRNKTDKAFWSGLGMTNGGTNQNDAANAVFQAAINMSYSTADLTAIHTRYTTAGYTLPAIPEADDSVKFDYDGDGKTDVSIFRPNQGQWWILRSSDAANNVFAFGESTDTITPADYTGDGKTDVAIWRESTGSWFVLRSEDSTFFAFPFGTSGDIPVPGDFDGDGTADAAVYRPSTSTWFIQNSGGGTTIRGFGTAGDIPTVQDFDGDGKDDIAIYRPSLAQFWQDRSQDGVIAYAFGQVGDTAVPADFTGDGKADVAVFRETTGQWFVLRSEDSSFYGFPFGTSGDIPAVGDYDGDGKADATVFRPSNNNWYKQQSTNGFEQVVFGTSGDIPTPAAYVP